MTIVAKNTTTKTHKHLQQAPRSFTIVLHIRIHNKCESFACLHFEYLIWFDITWNNFGVLKIQNLPRKMKRIWFNWITRDETSTWHGLGPFERGQDSERLYCIQRGVTNLSNTQLNWGERGHSLAEHNVSVSVSVSMYVSVAHMRDTVAALKCLVICQPVDAWLGESATRPEHINCPSPRAAPLNDLLTHLPRLTYICIYSI